MVGIIANKPFPTLSAIILLFFVFGCAIFNDIITFAKTAKIPSLTLKHEVWFTFIFYGFKPQKYNRQANARLFLVIKICKIYCLPVI